jgi:hypothetical protein
MTEAVVFVVRAYPPLLPPPRCECCGNLESVEMEPSRTQYRRDPTPWERRAGQKLFRELTAAYRLGGAKAVKEIGAQGFTDRTDPWVYESMPVYDEVANQSLSLCRSCAADHHANWDDQWAEYYAGLM